MKKIIPFIFLLVIGCNQVSPELQTEITSIKEKLATAEKSLQNANEDKTAFIHTVFFWMNEEVTNEQKADFTKNGLGKLTTVKSIYKSYYGPPAMTPREVVDNSYDIALVVHFENAAQQDAYQDDPIHLKMIEDYKHLWKRVQVYDNLLSE